MQHLPSHWRKLNRWYPNNISSCNPRVGFAASFINPNLPSSNHLIDSTLWEPLKLTRQKIIEALSLLQTIHGYPSNFLFHVLSPRRIAARGLRCYAPHCFGLSQDSPKPNETSGKTGDEIIPPDLGGPAKLGQTHINVSAGKSAVTKKFSGSRFAGRAPYIVYCRLTYLFGWAMVGVTNLLRSWRLDH